MRELCLYLYREEYPMTLDLTGYIVLYYKNIPVILNDGVVCFVPLFSSRRIIRELKRNVDIRYDEMYRISDETLFVECYKDLPYICFLAVDPVFVKDRLEWLLVDLLIERN